MKVFIITEGGRNIGFGHITRCISLYQAFEEKNIIPKFIVNGDSSLNNFLEDKNFEIFDWILERKKLFQLVKSSEIALIDSYLANFSIYKALSNLVKIPVYLDDNKKLDYPKGIVVNGNIYAEKINYPSKKDVTYLLGTRYFPLRKEFWELPEKKIKADIETLMITFGGNDKRNMTPKVLKMLSDKFPQITKNIVIAKGFQKIENIRIAPDKNINLVLYPDAKKMKNIMLESDIAISSCGLTLYELARVGVPTIGICVAENQLENVKGWQKAGFLEYAGWWEDEYIIINLINSINKMKYQKERLQRSKAGKRFVFGKSCIDLANFLMDKLN